jgi:signal transduction histidine kinase
MRRRLLISYVSLTALVLVLLEVPLGIAIADNERSQLETNVQHDAFALALRSEEALEHPSTSKAAIQELADDYRDDQGGRVVFVDASGRVLADGEPPGNRPTSGRSFRSRPEIARALRGLESTGERFSHTLDCDLLYVAVPIATGGELHGAVRITYPLSFVNGRIRDNWLVLAAVGGVVLLLVFVVSVVLARSITRPLADMEQGAVALGRGDLATRVPVPEGPRELHALAQSFNSTAGRLEQLMSAQQAFVADASHQLRTPLAGLRLRLENLDRDIAPAARDDLDGALDEVNRLSVLVDGLLELARAGQHGSSPAPVDSQQLAIARREAWSALAAERDVRIDVRVEDDAIVLATPGRLEQVLDNLLNNALEVAPVGSVIELSATRADGEVLLGVADAGPGMSEDQRARAFDRFWRAGGDRAGETAGFGLGLAIVRQLVVADGGEVMLGASAAGGLQVTLRLPAGT